jgi:CBS domain-containing protein
MSTEATGLTVRSLMTWPLAFVGSGATLRELATEMAMEEIGALIVLGPHGSPIGLVSERDLIRNLAAGADPDEVQAVDVMTAPIIEVEADESVAVVARTMLDAGIRHMPIRREGEIVGMISIRDVLDALLSA